LIAAKDASKTIARAVRSALAEPIAAEVVVVDDGSGDDTAGAARACDDGSGRLRVLVLDRNHGPAFARNHAIANSSAPLIAVLDADDFFLEGRFGRMLDGDDWDLVADNVLFVHGPEEDPDVPPLAPDPYFLDLRAFVEGNIAKRGERRAETGFLKPVMRREFLDRNGLRYDERLRLGEDFDLYVRALASGARYKVVRSCGYGAVVRPESLSGRHATEDLRRLWQTDEALLKSGSLPKSARAVVVRHARQVRARYELRNFLDDKAASGLQPAIFNAARSPLALPVIAAGILRDKAKHFNDRYQPGRGALATRNAKPRYLLPARSAGDGRDAIQHRTANGAICSGADDMTIQLPPNISSGRADGIFDHVRMARQRARLAFDPAYRPDPIFVLGTGRSGTHWVAWILEPHPELHTLIEKPPIFEWVTEMAIDATAEHRLLASLLERYRLEAGSARPKRLLDKSHPNIWLAERLAQAFPQAKFIGVLRDVYGTVASSLRHEGVSYWAENWEKYPVPNRFLGVHEGNREAYAKMSLAGRCAVRWQTHLHRLDELETTLGDRMIRLRYRDLQTKTAAELARLQGFLGFSAPIPSPEIKAESLERWKKDLSEQQIEEIRAVVGADAERS
jgi:succinoglycan biosynthesis protein ExoU